MRYVSFVNRLELKVPGNVLAHAICLGDVDNDGVNELAVGNVSGSLLVFKGITTRHPLCVAEGLGLITCMGVGDVFSRDQNHLVCVNAEGQLYAFDVKGVARSTNTKTPRLQPVLKQRLPPNTRTMLLANLCNDDPCTLVLGFTDRMVRAYHWVDSGRLPSDSVILGKFVQVDAWSFDGQVGSLSVTHPSPGQRLLIVSQPGGQYVTLDCSHWQNRHRTDSSVDVSHPPASAVYTCSLVQSKHYPEAPTEVVGSLRRAGSSEPTDLISLATLNGSVTLLEGNTVQWQLHVGHQLFSLTKMDVTGDGADEVVASGFDGFTYIVNHARDVVRFQVDESLCAFCAGSFGIAPDKSTQSLIYLTLNGKLLIYYDVRLSSMVTKNLLEEMKSKNDQVDFLPDDIKEGIADGDGGRVRSLYSWCMKTSDEDVSHQLTTLRDQLSKLEATANATSTATATTAAATTAAATTAAATTTAAAATAAATTVAATTVAATTVAATTVAATSTAITADTIASDTVCSSDTTLHADNDESGDAGQETGSKTEEVTEDTVTASDNPATIPVPAREYAAGDGEGS